MTFGIDFGTSNSVVARWTGSGTEVVPVDGGNLPAEWNRPGFDMLFPSVAALRDVQRTLCFGWTAKCGPSEPVDAVKRMLASHPRTAAGGGRRDAPGSGLPAVGEHEVWFGDEPYRSTAVAAALFDRMRDGVRRNLRDLDEAVVTIPANASGAARYRTRAAARLAGINVKALVNEPTAAAISYAHDFPGEGRFLVFDWGGGTIDVTVLEHYDGIFDERASRGITALGGLEFDEALATLVLRKLGRIPEHLTRRERRGWRRDVELTKIALAQPGVEEVLFETPDGSQSVVVRREEFEQAVAHLVRDALRPVEECLGDLGLGPEVLDAVLLIGGTSQIPLVRREVEELLGIDVVDSALCHPMTAVARGAAIAAAEIDGLVDDACISVATTHDLGLAFPAGDQIGFAPVIPRYSTLPARGSRSAQPAVQGASKVLLDIVEGDSSRAADDERTFPLARLELSIPRPSLAPDENRFDVDYRYDRSGILKVRATLRNNGAVVLDKELDCFGPDGTPLAHGLDRDMAKLLSRIIEPAQRREPPGTPTVPAPRPPAGRPAEVRPTAAAPAEALPTLLLDGTSIAYAGRRDAGKRPPDFALVSSAMAALRRDYPQHRVICVVGDHLLDLMEDQDPAAIEAARDTSGDFVILPDPSGPASMTGLMEVAERKNGAVVSMDSLTRFVQAYPWLRTPGRLVTAIRVDDDWIFMAGKPA
ncbi:hypothetical protein GCM10023205_73930 [Yinghuangia aomiensis]|uniref:Molecular chaperone DnaK (HSP70) n=1 Tax=Yinghuangia aomiensis TaxID=676205 RepID=A0ABP9I9G1_9ACTN